MIASVHANGEPPSDVSGEAVPIAFRQTLAATLAAHAEYRRLNSLTAIDPSYRDPVRFVVDHRAQIFADAGVWTAEVVESFFRWAERQAGACSLLLVLGALDALERDDQPLAIRRSGRALALDSNNLHVQLVSRQANGVTETPLTGRFCRAPFQNIETAPDGGVYFCCPAWLPAPIGRLTGEGGSDAVWNSAAAQEIRRSIHDGDYRYCSRTHCPHLSLENLPAAEDVKNAELRAIAASRVTKVRRGPKKIVLSHDRSCNLSCPSCRTTTLLARKDEQKQLNRIADDVILPMLRDADRVHVTGSGDPFGSAHFRYVLKRLSRDAFPKLRLDIQTNGVLFDEAAWDDLDLNDRIDKVAVSIDAATEPTYAIVRRGGDFARLMDNLAFLAGKRASGALKTMRLDFVVQAINFREMPALVGIAGRFGFDGIKFQMIRNWNTYSAVEFQRNNIGSREHPEYVEFLNVLRQEVLQAPAIEFWGMANAIADARNTPVAPPADGARRLAAAWPIA